MLIANGTRSARTPLRVQALAFAIFVVALFAAPQRTDAGTAVWIDTDLSIGSPLREVDDAYAVLIAARSPEIRIAGITTTYGNASLRFTTRRTRDFVARCGLRTPVYEGAASARDLYAETSATSALAAALQHGRRLTYIALGPLTNLAAFLQRYPELASHIDKIVAVGGRSPDSTLGFGPGERFRIHDANVAKDPAAVRAVLRSHVPLVLAPIETSSALTFDRHDLDALDRGSVASQYLAQNSRVWLAFWTLWVRAEGGPVFDALPVTAIVNPSFVTIQQRFARFDRADNLICTRSEGPGARRIQFCAALKPGGRRFLLDRLRSDSRGRLHSDD